MILDKRNLFDGKYRGRVCAPYYNECVIDGITFIDGVIEDFKFRSKIHYLKTYHGKFIIYGISLEH